MSHLACPPSTEELNRRPLRTQQARASQWFRVSQHTSGEPFFNTSRFSRFADPAPEGVARYSTCYIGESLEVAVAETLLHDLMPSNGGFGLALAQIARRSVVQFTNDQPLILADMTGVALKTLVGSSELSTVTDYSLPQQWAKAIFQHPQQVDGLLYQSRHVNDQKAIVVFDRAASKLGKASYQPLLDHIHWPRVQTALNIQFVVP